MRHKVKRVHFVGIGGIGMSGIAEVLLNLGYQISGSDLVASEVTRSLERLGATVHRGHSASHLFDADVVVTSSAVRADNPEVAAALERGIPVIPRAEMLAELMRMKQGIAVAGTHGKTTTTSMLATVLGAAGLDPTVVIGGKLAGLGSNARLGQGEILVAEADESDGSFLKLTPTYAVVTNIDPEHLDHYGHFEAVKEAFVDFMNRVPFYGMTAACGDHPVVREILPRVTRRVVTYGESEAAQVRGLEIVGERGGCALTVVSEGRGLGRIHLGMPGRHNAINALATVAIGLELELPFPIIAQALEGFSGVHRRFEVKATKAGVTVVDDYGHHPAEIVATLLAAKEYQRTTGLKPVAQDDRFETCSPGRIVAVFQPHRYTRTRDLLGEFARAFSIPELLVLTEIYAASEDPIPGVSGERLFAAIAAERSPQGLRTWFVAERAEIVERLLPELGPGDLVLTLGAGNIWEVGEELVARLEGKES